ncbi:MAG: class IV adenylate cyclase [Bacteroidia bacterium]
MQEIEAKILEIDTDAIQAKLGDLGAAFEFEQEFFAIYYDDAVGRLGAAQQVLRIRKEGDDVRLTMKSPSELSQAGIRSREELELSIGDFEMMRTILGKLGYNEYLKMRKIRRQYALGDAHVVIDTHIDDLAFIPPYMEIEAPSHDRLLEVSDALGFERRQLLDWNAARVMDYYRERVGK